MSRFTKFLSLFMVTLLFSVAVIGSACADSVTIKGPRQSAGGSSYQKSNDNYYATIKLNTWANCEEKVTAGVYNKTVAAIATARHNFTSLSSFDLYYLNWPNHDDFYYPVFQLSSPLNNGVQAEITYTFTP